MRTRAFGWVSALVGVLYLFQAVAAPLYAADAAKGEPVAVGRDLGEAVAPGKEEKSSLWPWVLGALAAGLGGWVIGDEVSNDDGAKDAQAAAAEAEASAAAAAAAGAGDVSAAGAEYKVFIQGTFEGSDPVTSNDVGLEFSLADEGDHPGGISDYRDSSDGSWADAGGRYDQSGKNTVFIKTDDGYYVGIATIVSETRIRLQNGTYLNAQGGAKAHIVTMPSE